MREIKFRGANKYHQWYFGDLEYNKKYDVARIHTYNEYGEYDKQYVVCSETIGQYTGLKDKNGKEIYEGDIVMCIDDECTDIGRVAYSESYAKFIVVYSEASGNWFDFEGTRSEMICLSSEVIGNVYDNKELFDTFKKIDYGKEH